MKNLLLLAIKIYQDFISITLKNILGVNKMCRLSPTCSEYARIAIAENGVFHGLGKSAMRILKCQPFISF